MNYTRTALGLLSAQYRSVLKKCFLINLGLFALGAVAAAPASASINDYKGVTYTGLGSDTATSSFYYQWTQDATTGVYSLHRLTDATGADIATASQDHRVYDYQEGIPGYTHVPGSEVPDYFPLDGAVFGGSADNISGHHWGTAVTLIQGIRDYERPIINTITNTAFIGYTSDLTTDYYMNDGGALCNYNNSLEKVDATFIGNSVIGGDYSGSGYAYFNGAVYGGAISTGLFHIPFGADIDPTHPEEAVVINELSGKFIANGVSSSYQTNYRTSFNLTHYPSIKKYQVQLFAGAFGGAVSNYYGGIGHIGKIDAETGEITKAEFSDNYVVSTSNTSNAGHVGGAAILNAVYGFYDFTAAAMIGVESKIGNIYADFDSNIAYTVNGDVLGGTILNQGGYLTTATMGNITGDFKKNTATALAGGIYGSAIGNIVLEDGGTATMGTISGTFSENTASATNGEIEGLIYNDDIVAGIENSTFDKNTGSAKNIYGGVIYNDGTITNGIKNSTFTDNTFTTTGEGLGAAIYTDQDLTIAADNGTTLFKGNKINDVASAIYMKTKTGATAAPQLSIEAKNNGTATFYDTIDGDNPYTTTITGDATGTVQLYNDISNSDVTVEKVTLETTDGTLHNYSLKSLTSNADSKWKIDINAKDKKADTFATDASATTASSGTVTLNELNYVDSAKSDIGEGFKVQVLKTQGTTTAADLQLALSDDLTEKFVIGEKEETVVDEVTANTKWSDEFNKKIITTKAEGQFGLATTDTLNDSIGVTISTDTTEDKEKLGDTLALVNQAEIADKNFTAATADEVYKAEDDSGTTYGNLTIKGVADGAQKSKIDLDGHNGFEVASGASVTLQDAALTDSQGKSPIDVAAGGKMSLQNADVSNVNLNIDGTLEAANNKVAAKKAVFGKDSVLKLNVNNINSDYGAIKADSFDIANGAKIDITFGQNPLDGKKFGEVALLSLSDGSDINNNNFSDEFHNNMYGFARKSDKSGIYGVYQTKTAREISEENGGSGNNQDAAGAWVDGPSHGNPTAQGIADDLARLAQTDGVEFNKVLTALAPNDDGMAQTALIDLTDRLLLTVDNHLIKTYLDRGLSSGDGKPDLSNVRAWIKTYYAKSKMQNHGGTYGYDADDRGFIAGVDKKIASATKVGIGMQFDDTDVNAFRRDVNIQTVQGYVYGEYRPSNWFVNGVMSYGRTDYDEDKFVLGRNIDAHYSADIYSVQGLTGYTFKYLTPELGARYYRIKRHGYVDGAMQSVSGNDLDLLRTTLGVKAETTYGIFKPHAYAGIMYDVISDSDDAVVSLPNGTSYTVDGKSMPRFGVEIGIGTTVVLNDNTEIGVGYEAKFRKHYQDHSGWLDFKYAF